MATAIPSAALVPLAPVFANTERLALAGFLAGYSGLTRQAYELDLRQFASWCQQHQHPPVRCPPRRHRVLRPRPRSAAAGPGPPSPAGYRPSPGSTATPSKKNSSTTLPAAHVRRPRLDYESHATGLDRNELGALLVAAGLGPSDGACADLAARAERAAGLRSHRRRHRSPGYRARSPDPGDHPQGGKVVTIPLAPRTARAIDLADRRAREGPIFLTADGHRLDRHGAGRIVRRVARRAGITKSVGPHTCATHSSPPRWMPGCHCGTSRKPPPTPTRAPRCATTGPAHRWTATPPTSSPPTSPAPPGRPLTGWYNSAWPDSGQAEPGHRKHPV